MYRHQAENIDGDGPLSAKVPKEDDVTTWIYMPWLDEYIMQNKRLTKEHYGLVYLANCIEHFQTGDDQSMAREIFVTDLVPLAKRHLRFELLVMSTIDYPSINPEGYKQHCESHGKLIEGIEDICANISTVSMAEVGRFLRNWLDTHIKNEDVSYNSEIMKLGISDG